MPGDPMALRARSINEVSIAAGLINVREIRLPAASVSRWVSGRFQSASGLVSPAYRPAWIFQFYARLLAKSESAGAS